MKTTLTIALIYLVSLSSFSQPTIEWQKSFGGSHHESARSVQQTTDGGYIVGGYTLSDDGDITDYRGYFDYWVVKLDASGILEWQKCLGGTWEDRAKSIQQTADGGYIVAGESESTDGDITSSHGRYDFWIVKLNASGVIEWENSLGGSESDYGNMIQQTVDGGYIVAGGSKSSDGDVTGNQGLEDIWIVKLTSTGAIEWEKSYGGSGTDSANSIQQTFDGGYIIAGISSSSDGDVTTNNGRADYWVLKLKSGGTIEWQKSFGGSERERAQSAQQTLDGGYIVVGGSESSDGDITGNHGEWDAWIVKLTNLGAIEWEKSLGGTSDDGANSIQQTLDGGYIIAGSSNSNDGDVTNNHGGVDLWMVKLTSTGLIESQNSFGGSEGDGAYSIQKTTDGGYVVSGSSRSSDGDVTFNQGLSDYWVIKFNGVLGIEESDLNQAIILSPNPNSGQFSLNFSKEVDVTSVTVVDALGKTVFSETNIPSGSFEINQNFTAGVYFVNIISTTSEATLKMIVR